MSSANLASDINAYYSDFSRHIENHNMIVESIGKSILYRVRMWKMANKVKLFLLLLVSGNRMRYVTVLLDLSYFVIAWVQVLSGDDCRGLVSAVHGALNLSASQT